MDLEESKHHFQSLRDIWHKKTENCTGDNILSQNGHGNGKTDMCHDKKNSFHHGKGKISRIFQSSHTVFAHCEHTHKNGQHQHHQYVCARDGKDHR